MTTTLTTEGTDSGQRLTNDSGKHVGTIAYNSAMAPQCWHVVTSGAKPENWWATLEAAQFYALACYADQQRIHGLD